jgi:hypothetical protein
LVWDGRSGMERPLGFEYPGAVYHVMVRSAGGEASCIAKEARLFMHRLVMSGAGRESVS